jgi:hypothetical protein
MHRPENMLKSHVFGGRKNPPGGLKLVNVPHSLDPGMVNHVLLGRFLLRQASAGDKRDVAMNWIV